MYKVMWWDAKGGVHISEGMDKATAEHYAKAMFEEQDARIVYCTK